MSQNVTKCHKMSQNVTKWFFNGTILEINSNIATHCYIRLIEYVIFLIFVTACIYKIFKNVTKCHKMSQNVTKCHKMVF